MNSCKARNLFSELTSLLREGILALDSRTVLIKIILACTFTRTHSLVFCLTLLLELGLMILEIEAPLLLVLAWSFGA